MSMDVGKGSAMMVGGLARVVGDRSGGDAEVGTCVSD